MKIKDARILITGGSLGIGKATASKLVEGGAKVIITGRDKERLQRAADETGAHPVAGDVTSSADRDATFAAVKDHLGGLDVLVNNAGIGEFAKIDSVTWDKFERVFATNVIAVALMTQKAVELFKGQNYGNIINIASTAAVKGFEGGTIYAASKFALRGMTQCWQAELRRHNIRVMEINPSEVTTAFGNPNREERPEQAKKLRSEEVAHAIRSVLQMDDRGFIPELSIWATNPW